MMFSKSRRSGLLMMSIVLGCVLTIGGCQSDPQQETLFDHDHEQPSHWPNNLGDISLKIRDRLEKLDSDQNTVGTELFDLVSWTPEIAADTSLPEQQWDPIYEASESLRLSLIDNGTQWDQDDRQNVQKLCVMIDAAWGQIPQDEKQAAEERRKVLAHSHDHGHHHEDGHHHDEDGHHHHEDGHHHDEDGHHHEDHAEHSGDDHDQEEDHSHDHEDEREGS